MTDSPVDPADQSRESLAQRRIRKLRASYPAETPEQIAQRLGELFIRDFVLVGGASAGAQEFTPSALGRLTSNPKIAMATRAAAHLGNAGQKISQADAAARNGVNTAAHVGSAQSVKAYAHGLALLHGVNVADSTDAAQQVLGGDINELLTTMDTEENKGASSVNVFGAVGVFAARNPKTMLLVKAGEQIARAGGAVATTTKARKEFAQQIIKQAHQNLGEFPTAFPAELEITKNGQDAGPSPAQQKSSAIQDNLAPRPADEDTPSGQVAAPRPVESIGPIEPSVIETDQDFDPTAATGAHATGARFAAKAFMKASSRFRK